MPHEGYSSVSLDEGIENGVYVLKPSLVRDGVKRVLALTAFAVVCFLIGLGVGQNWTNSEKSMSWSQPGVKGHLLPPQAFIPESRISAVFGTMDLT